MRESLFSVHKLREDAEFVRAFIDGDDTQTGGFLDEFSKALLPLLDAVEASQGACWQINDYLGQRFGKSMETSPLGCFQVMAAKLAAFDFEEPVDA